MQLNKKIKIGLLFLIFFLLGGYLFPKLFFSDAQSLDKKISICAKKEAASFLNPLFESVWIFSTAAQKLVNNSVEVNLYTFWGIRYARVVVNDIKIINQPGVVFPGSCDFGSSHIERYLLD